MLSNVTWLAIVAIHTAANEPPKVRQVMNKIHRNVAEDALPRGHKRRRRRVARRHGGGAEHAAGRGLLRGLDLFVERFGTECNPDLSPTSDV